MTDTQQNTGTDTWWLERHVANYAWTNEKTTRSISNDIIRALVSSAREAGYEPDGDISVRIVGYADWDPDVQTDVQKSYGGRGAFVPTEDRTARYVHIRAEVRVKEKK